MSLTARLHIEGHAKQQDGLQVISCSFGFVQDVDKRGYPTSGVYGGQIELQLLNENDPEIIQWMFQSAADKNGKVTFHSDSTSTPSHSVHFRDGRLIKYHESFKSETEVIVTLVITAREIEISGETHTNIWSGYQP